jgi:hypothetical protein
MTTPQRTNFLGAQTRAPRQPLGKSLLEMLKITGMNSSRF